VADKIVPNIFILLGLDPDKPWDQVEFERQLNAKRQEWSRLTNLANEKGLQARLNLGLVDEIKRIAGNNELRKAHVVAARQERLKENAEKIRQLDESLKLLQAKGFVLQAEFDQLMKNFKGLVSESDLHHRLSVPIKKGSTAAQPHQEALEASLAKEIADQLRGLNKISLYDFLGMDENIDTDLLKEKAKKLYKEVVENNKKTPEVTLANILCGHCLRIFKSDSERAKYDESLRRAVFEDIKHLVDIAAEVSRELDARQLDQIMRDARQKKLNPEETLLAIKEYASQKKYSIVMPAGLIDAIHQLRRCGYCKQLNEADSKFCAYCSKPLQEPCPRCAKLVASDDMACRVCGFPTGNRSYVEVLLSDAEQARKEREYKAAMDQIEQARLIWPMDGNDALPQKVKSLEAAIGSEYEAQEALARKMETAIQQKRYYEARNLLGPLQKAMPIGSQQLEQCRRTIDEEIGRAEEKLARVRRMRNVNPEDLIGAYQEVLSICRDCQEAREMLAKTPPSSPSHLQATVTGRLVHLSWTASQSQGVKYRVVRKDRSRPVSVNAGKELATVEGTVYDDLTGEVGIPYFYAVFADREGVYSKNGALLDEPVMLLQEVDKPTVRVSDRQVQLSWEAPPNVHKVVVKRSEKDYPVSIEDGELISAVDRSKVLDSRVQNERRYYYTIFCQFRDMAGKLRATSGVRVEAIPQTPPSPIKKVEFSASGSIGKRKVRLQWPPVGKGNVIIVKSDKPTGLEHGSVIARDDLLRYGSVLESNSNQAIDEINHLGVYYYVPVVVFQGMAYIGQEHNYVCVEDVSELKVHNLGHALRLQWRWPPNCNEVVIVYSHSGWPELNRGDATKASLTRAEYELQGHFDIVNPKKADYYIVVFAVIGQGEHKAMAYGEHVGARQRVSLGNRIVLEYEIKRSWPIRKTSLELRMKGEGTLPAIVLISKQHALPLNKDDGEIVLRLEPRQVGKGQLSFEISDVHIHRQSFARLFLEDENLYDMVIIRQPDREKLKLR
jgi:hypothetical protein